MQREIWLERLTEGDEVAVKTILCLETQYDSGWVVESVSEEEIVVTKDNHERAFCKKKGAGLCDTPTGEQGEVLCFIIKPEQVTDIDYLMAEDLARAVSEIDGYTYREIAVWALLETIEKYKQKGN